MPRFGESGYSLVEEVVVHLDLGVGFKVIWHKHDGNLNMAQLIDLRKEGVEWGGGRSGSDETPTSPLSSKYGPVLHENITTRSPHQRPRPLNLRRLHRQPQSQAVPHTRGRCAGYAVTESLEIRMSVL